VVITTGREKGVAVFKGIKLAEFLNTPEELHALVIGLAEVVCLFPPRHKIMTWQKQYALYDEYHYYALGRVLGVFVLLGIAAIIKGVFF